MTVVPERPERRRRTKLAAIVLIIVLEVGGVVYLMSGASFGASTGPTYKYTFPPSTTSKSTTKTTTTGPPPNSVNIKSALIFNDTLSLDIKNVGTHWVKSVALTGICTPDLKDCYSYQALSGHSLSKIFALAPKAEFVENITGVCVMPVASCAHYMPVANFSYYYAVTFSFESGKPITLPVAAKANNTYPARATVQGLSYKLGVTLKNSTGKLDLSLLVNNTIYAENFTAMMFTRAKAKGSFSLKLLSNKTGCGGSLALDCSSGRVNMTTGFSTVTTGIGTPFFPPPYMLVVRALNGTVNRNLLYATWMPAVNATVNM
jgi:hypothetical protein